jgi:hypothetical protein
VEGIPNKLRSTATLATYFETLYPNAVVSVRLGQDLRYLDRLVNQRIDAVTALERSLYTTYLGYKRPTVRVGKMAEGVDATRHYSQILQDLNTAIAKEQDSANARAHYVERMSGRDPFSIIEGFLQITEIGSLKKLLKKQSGSANKWLKGRSSVRSFSGKDSTDGRDGRDGKDSARNSEEGFDRNTERGKDDYNDEGLRERRKSTDEYDSYQSALGEESIITARLPYIAYLLTPQYLLCF